MDNLPPELLRAILLSIVHSCRSKKNAALPLRLVNKRFNFIIQEYTFRTVQLDYTRLAKGRLVPQLASLKPVGHLSQSLYCDMMVIRDEEEITRLFQVFSSILEKVPEMTTLLDSLRQYCMGNTTFDETDFRRAMEGVLQATPNMTRLKLNLPFQVIGRASRTATLLLATTFACFADRPASFSKPLETLVIDHVSDSTMIEICQNPIDLGNALSTFKYLRNLMISIKRQESAPMDRSIFASRLWYLISEAQNLESLCISGWNVKTRGSRRYRPRVSDVNDWYMKCLPYESLDVNRSLRQLRFLELKRVDMDPIGLLQLIEQNSSSLKELYLSQVYLKVLETPDNNISALWIGNGPAVKKPPDCFWLARDLREMESLNLDILRVTDLGYNEFDTIRETNDDMFDMKDPTGLNRTFEERFVEAVLGASPSEPKLATSTAVTCVMHSSGEDTTVGHLVHNDENMNTIAAVQPSLSLNPVLPTLMSVSPASSSSSSETRPRRLLKLEYDAECFQRIHNTTSHWKCSIDELFYNHNETALTELQKIISVADRGMTLLSEEIERLNSMRALGEDT